jgi:hypothetical protein
MKKEKQTHMALRVFLFVALLSLLGGVNAQEPPVEGSSEKECIFYAYTSSMNHYFLLQNNSIVFGDNISIIHNCEYLQVNQNNLFLARSNNSFLITANPGVSNLTFITPNQTIDMTIQFFPDRLQWEYEYSRLNFDQDTEFISVDVANSKEVVASIASIIIVWVLCVYVYWRLIESYVNKNFIEEVVN